MDQSEACLPLVKRLPQLEDKIQKILIFFQTLLVQLLAMSLIPLFWFTGFILGDIFFKAVLTDIDEKDTNDLLEGGLVQRIHTEKEKHVPGGPEFPFVEEKV